MITSAQKVSRIKGISEKKTIFLVDNNVISRARLRNSIRLSNKYMIIGESEYDNYFDKISLFNPNVLIFSSCSDIIKNSVHLERVKRDFPLIKLIIIAKEIDENEFLHAVNAGVAGYFSINTEPDELVQLIDDAIVLGAAFDRTLSKFVFRLLCTLGDKLKPCHFDKSPDEQFNLTHRELEVASVMSESSQYKDVAKKLHISNDTVKMHMSHIYKKLGVSTKHEAILKLQSKILEFKLSSTF